MVRSEDTAEDSFAKILERSKFGIAMAAMIKMIATTIRSSMRENPFCGFCMVTLTDLDSLSVPAQEKRCSLLGAIYGPLLHGRRIIRLQQQFGQAHRFDNTEILKSTERKHCGGMQLRKVTFAYGLDA